jgi:hypothetical protein
MGRPSCQCCDPCESDTPCDDDSTAQHQNRDGNTADYTLSTKVWGGITINSYSLTTEASGGFPDACLKLHVDWSQTQTPGYGFPQPATPSSGYEPLMGAWVIVELNGGPQVSLSAGEWFEGATLLASCKRVAHTPTPQASRIMFDGTISGGSFTITVDGMTTSAIAYPAAVADVQSAISALTGLSGIVSVTGWPLDTPFKLRCYLVSWSDGTQRTLSVNTSGLIGTSIFGAVTAARHFDYRLVPVVIRDGTVYGPLFGQQSAGDGTDRNERCWYNGGGGPNCPSQITGAGDPYTQNFALHSRYREFLENVAAWPAGMVGNNCQQYCRAEDAFGDWSAASVENAIPRIIGGSSGDFDYHTWVPATVDFSSGDYTIGWAVGVCADVPGDYSIDMLIDNLCLDWSVREPIPDCGGSLVVDEPMDTDVPDWTASVMNYDPPDGDCDFTPQYFGANWRIDDGWLITDDVYDGSGGTEPIGDYTGGTYGWRDRIYAGGSLWTDAGISKNQTNSFCLIVECEVARLHEEDAEIDPDDAPFTAANPTSTDLNSIRPEEDFGIFIGGIARLGVVRNKINYGDDWQNHDCAKSYYYLDASGLIGQSGELQTICMGADWGTYECDNVPGPGTHRVNVGSEGYSTFSYDRIMGVPLKYDTLRLMVRWSRLTVDAGDCAKNSRYYVNAWINGQANLFMENSAHSALRDVAAVGSLNVAWLNDPSVGIYAKRGGRFRNFRAWLTT